MSDMAVPALAEAAALGPGEGGSGDGMAAQAASVPGSGVAQAHQQPVAAAGGGGTGGTAAPGAGVGTAAATVGSSSSSGAPSFDAIPIPESMAVSDANVTWEVMTAMQPFGYNYVGTFGFGEGAPEPESGIVPETQQLQQQDRSGVWAPSAGYGVLIDYPAGHMYIQTSVPVGGCFSSRDTV
jgi:hypothetical protein